MMVKQLLMGLALTTLLAGCGGPPQPAQSPTDKQADDKGKVDDTTFESASGAPAAKPMSPENPDLVKGISEVAAWFANGMKGDGPIYVADLPKKGRAKVELSLKQGKCYAIIGFSPAGQVVDYDLHLWSVSPPKLVGTDDDDDTTPTVFKTPFCPDKDAAFVLEQYADTGTGLAAVQLFSKDK